MDAMRGRCLVAVHVDAALEAGALGDADAGRRDIPADLGGFLHDHGFFGPQVALDRTLDDDGLRANIRLDRALGSDRQALRVRDRPFEAPLDQQVLVGGKIAFEIQGRTQDGGTLLGAVMGIAHVRGSPDLMASGRRQKSTWHNPPRRAQPITNSAARSAGGSLAFGPPAIAAWRRPAQRSRAARSRAAQSRRPPSVLCPWLEPPSAPARESSTSDCAPGWS